MQANAPFRQPSNRVNRFSQVPKVNASRSVFDLSKGHKGTMQDAGYLFPIYLEEIYPGDTFKIKSTIFCRLLTQLVPIMDNLYMDTFWFFVPNRLVWENWERFMGARDPDPDSSIDYTIPQITSPATGWVAWGVASGFGLPVLKASTMSISALPHKMYRLIWNTWFRDQNIQDAVAVSDSDATVTGANYDVLLQRGKRHDYFTSCLPWPQKGDAIDLPLGTSAPIMGLGVVNQTWAAGPVSVYETDGTGAVSYANYKSVDGVSADRELLVEEDPTNDNFPNIRADLSNASAATINQWREALQIQALLERDARGGTRYVEILQSQFGVTSPDSRLQNPEFLGGGSVPFNQQSVAQTTFQGTETRLDAKGALAANSVFVGRDGVFKSFVEHGYLMCLLNIRADITYQQGIERHFLRASRYDYYFPLLAHIGEQVVETREIFYAGTGSPTADPPTGDYAVFGYQERFAELRSGKSYISGTLQSDATTTLDYWHLAQDFSAAPTLSDTFIKDTPPIARITGVTPATNVPAFMFDAWFNVRAVRPLPAYGVPGNLGRF